ncbi:MAG: Em GEA1 (EM1) [Myxococcota bacterium]
MAKDREDRPQSSKGRMTVEEAGHLGGVKGGEKGGQRVKELVEEGKEKERREGGPDKR